MNFRPRRLALRRMLVPLDFSGESRQALEVAIPLARLYQATISLIHAVEHPVYPEAFGHLHADLNTPGKDAYARLSEMRSRLLPVGMAGQICVYYGNACESICATAEDLDVDLIVISTHGRTGLSHALLGSTTERVVRHAHCPVLTVRRHSGIRVLNGPKDTGERLPWERILVPLDFSKNSIRALGVAVHLAEDIGAQLHLLHVAEVAPYVTTPDGAILAVTSPRAYDRAKAQLPIIARRCIPAALPVTTIVRQGQPSRMILQTAYAQRSDLIVLSAHGNPKLGNFPLGRAAEHVVRGAACSVFVVRPGLQRNVNKPNSALGRTLTLAT